MIDSIIEPKNGIEGDEVKNIIPNSSSSSHLIALYECEFSTFLKWYCGDLNKFGGGFGLDPILEDSHYSRITSVKDAMQMVGDIRSQLYRLELSGQLLQLRASRVIGKMNADLQDSKARSIFRRNAPPRLQCCQCKTSFSLFTHYTYHFSSSGIHFIDMIYTIYIYGYLCT